MESPSQFWILLLLLSTFVFPQLLGILLYFRLVGMSRWLAFAVGVLVPAVLFFFLAPLFFLPGVQAVQQNSQSGCGMPGLAAAFMMLAGTAAELIVALPIQLHLLRRNR